MLLLPIDATTKAPGFCTHNGFLKISFEYELIPLPLSSVLETVLFA